MTPLTLALAVLPMLLVSPASFQHADVGGGANDAACTAAQAAVPLAFRKWTWRAPTHVGPYGGIIPTIKIGQGYDVGMSEAFTTPLAVENKRANAGPLAGMLRFDVARAGTYRVALSDKAWVDVTRAHDAIPSVAHRMGPRCSGIAKMVDFTLVPGHYYLQLSGATNPRVVAMIARVK